MADAIERAEENLRKGKNFPPLSPQQRRRRAMDILAYARRWRVESLEPDLEIRERRLARLKVLKALSTALDSARTDLNALPDRRAFDRESSHDLRICNWPDFITDEVLETKIDGLQAEVSSAIGDDVGTPRKVNEGQAWLFAVNCWAHFCHEEPSKTVDGAFHEFAKAAHLILLGRAPSPSWRRRDLLDLPDDRSALRNVGHISRRPVR
ncbi:hypothetical protein [Hyphococcus sp.]